MKITKEDFRLIIEAISHLQSFDLDTSSVSVSLSNLLSQPENQDLYKENS